jgi:DNA-binding CsgD family transcriptional regulator
MAARQMLERARQAFERKAWAESYQLFKEADGKACLEPQDLERLATAASLLGLDLESEAYWARAHQTFLDRGDYEGAARSASQLASQLLQLGAAAPASGWFARAERILDDARLDCVIRGYLLIPSAIQRIVQGDPAAGHAAFTQAAEIAMRFGDRDLASFAWNGQGRALIRLGDIRNGVARLDEAMAAIIAGEVSPAAAGDVYCSLLEACQEIFDLRRAHEWTASLARWCAAQPEVVRYRGECLLYRAEVLQLRGNWDDAAQDALAACELLASRPAAGAAFYRLGEIHRLRGEFDDAEAAYTRAHQRGRKPQPGLSLLRLEQGEIAAAAASIRGAVLDTSARSSRARVLAAAVEILLAADDLDQARAAAAELSEIAGAFGAPLLSATSAHAAGAVHLAAGDSEGASVSLRQASDGWRDLGTPYEEARTCLLLAAACERRGDRDGHRLELQNARRLFEELHADRCLARIDAPTGLIARPPAGALSEREMQVLRLLATGKTNRDIAEALFISERTVARHVSNIFDKLNVSTRSAATAWAYRHSLT